jgi:hypothetical protein
MWKTILTSVLSALLVALVLKAIDAPLKQWFEPKAISADVELGPYVEIPLEVNNQESQTTKFVVPYDSFASLKVRNRSGQTIHALKITFGDGTNGSFQYLIIGPNIKSGGEVRWDKLSDRPLRLPDLEPGDVLHVYFKLYTLFPGDMFNKARLYSTAGVNSIHLAQPSQYHVLDQSFLDFVWEYIDYIAPSISLIIIIIFWIDSRLRLSHIKALLSDSEFYLAEQIMFEENPRDYIPNISAGQKIIQNNFRKK